MAVRAKVEAVSKQATGFLTVAQAQLVVLGSGQQGAHRAEHTEGCLGQRAPSGTDRAETERCDY